MGYLKTTPVSFWLFLVRLFVSSTFFSSDNFLFLVGKLQYNIKSVLFNDVVLPLPDRYTLRYVWVSLQRGLVLPDEQDSGEHRQGLGVDVQGPRTLRERSYAQLLQQGILGKTNKTYFRLTAATVQIHEYVRVPPPPPEYVRIRKEVPLTCRAGEGRSDVTSVWLKRYRAEANSSSEEPGGGGGATTHNIKLGIY